MVTARESDVELAATDLETSVRLPTAAQVSQPGRALVPARLLLDVVRMAPGSEVACELESASQSFVVRSNANTAQLRVLREEDFPQFTGVAQRRKQPLPGRTFASAVGQVGRAASRDETRPLLTGVSMTAAEGTLRIVATDSYRLAVKEMELDGSTASFQVTVPARALTEAARLAQQEGAEGIDVAGPPTIR